MPTTTLLKTYTMTRCSKLLALIILYVCLSSCSAGFVHWHRSTSAVKLRRSNKISLNDASLLQIDSILPFVNIDSSSISTTEIIAGNFLEMDQDAAEALAGPLFGLSLFPYLAFIYFLNVDENDCPKGVVVGFAACLLFVFLTIPAAIAAKVLYDVSLANCDWLHGSAESMLTITNLATVIPFRQALFAKSNNNDCELPVSSTSYAPTLWLVGSLTLFAVVTAVIPAISHPFVHTKYLNGCLDLPIAFENFGANAEPDNALTVATWIIHVSSLVEFLVAMGFCWRWADVVKNPTWKGLTWGLLPLHSSGITACVSHLFYNQIAILVPMQAFLTCVGNATAAYAAFRIAISNGWKPNWSFLPGCVESSIRDSVMANTMDASNPLHNSQSSVGFEDKSKSEIPQILTYQTLVGFEDLGDSLAEDNDAAFLIKLFIGCALFSYLIKYGELFFNFPFEASVPLCFSMILIPSMLNAYKWNRRSQDSSFEGWF
jgi:Protein of unknown function (DUF3593)/Protein of unknown function (DUF2499)